MPAGRVADLVAQLGIDQDADHLDDVPRRAELAVLAGRGDLGQQVFVQVALRVVERLAALLPLAFDLGVDLVDDPDRFDQQRRLGDQERGVLHVPRERLVVAAQALDEREDPVADVGQHLLARQMAEVAPAEFLLRAPLAVGRGVGALEQRGVRIAGPFGPFLALAVGFVQPAQEQQVADLLHRRQRVGDAAGPELVPQGVDLGFDGFGEHGLIARGGLFV